jgi:hypothetical protein
LVPLLLIAILNGSLRDAWHGKSLSALRAHQISTLAGAVLLGIYIGAVTRLRELQSAGQDPSVGLIWLVMIVGLELLCGHHIAERPWSQLPFQDYNFFAGDVWALLVVWVTLAHYVFFRLHP